jgi:serine/threonine protein phosphatase PrpC
VLDGGGPSPGHEEVDLGWVAAVTDRGRRHHVNEDAMALASVADTMVAVVCDGVSSTPGSAIASRAAADAALFALHRAVGDADAWADGMREAIEAARVAASAAPAPDPGNPPACTIVAVVGGLARVAIGWLGDSRAYWLDDSGGQCLTQDDSWGAERVAAGVMTTEIAEADRRAHLITRWLGADAPLCEPHVLEFEPPGTGTLLLCSDGLWNYGPGPEVLAQHIWGSAGETARRLCEFALISGGQDNVTVVVARLAKEAGDDVSP